MESRHSSVLGSPLKVTASQCTCSVRLLGTVEDVESDVPLKAHKRDPIRKELEHTAVVGATMECRYSSIFDTSAQVNC